MSKLLDILPDFYGIIPHFFLVLFCRSGMKTKKIVVLPYDAAW
jgi:hypothetical protein